MKTKIMCCLFLVSVQLRCQSYESCWETKTRMSAKRVLHASACSGGKIYIISGSTGDNSEFRDMTTVEMYDPKSNHWVTKADIPRAISLSCAATINDKIYIVGGEEEAFSKKSKALMVYDCIQNKWAIKSSMNIGRSFHCAVTLDNKIYVIGGRESNNEIKFKKKDSLAIYTVEEYDIDKNTWKIKSIMPFKHFTIGAVAVNNKIYVLSDTTNNGMLGSSAILEVYDPQKNTFTKKAELVPSQCDAAVVEFKNRIYVLGGWRKGTIPYVQEYDIAKDSWTRRTDMPYASQSHQAVVLGNKIFISGGLNYSKGGNEKRNDFIVYYPELDNKIER